MSVRAAYDRWPQYNRRFTERVAELTDAQLALRPSAEHWPIWAIVGHTAGSRVYWLCHVFGEPGAETTPFAGPYGEGWEDDPDHPRSAAELVDAMTCTFAIVERALDRWTPDSLGDTVVRMYRDQRQLHDRASVLQRMLTHEAYHVGEISQTLGQHGLEEIYIWRQYDA
jgi:uncharacterized damage-inducible protein DinB